MTTNPIVFFDVNIGSQPGVWYSVIINKATNSLN